MAHKIGISLETISEERRDSFLLGLSRLMAEYLHGVDTVELTYERQGPTLRGKRIIRDKIKLEQGSYEFMLAELGIGLTQRELFFEEPDEEPEPDEQPSSDITDRERREMPLDVLRELALVS